MIQSTVNTVILSITATIFYFTIIAFCRKFLFEFRTYNMLAKQKQYIIPTLTGLDYFEKEILKQVIKNCPMPVHESSIRERSDFSIDNYNKAIKKLVDDGYIIQDGKYYTLPKVKGDNQ